MGRPRQRAGNRTSHGAAPLWVQHPEPTGSKAANAHLKFSASTVTFPIRVCIGVELQKIGLSRAPGNAQFHKSFVKFDATHARHDRSCNHRGTLATASLRPCHTSAEIARVQPLIPATRDLCPVVEDIRPGGARRFVRSLNMGRPNRAGVGGNLGRAC